LIRRVQRGSFYDNVPSPVPVHVDSREMPAASQNISVDEQQRFMGSTIYDARSGGGALEMHRQLGDGGPATAEIRRERRTTQIETQVVQLPNNITCVRVGDNLDGMPPIRQQYYDIPVR
uniref:Miff domain-containing protein n=1 Tax=Gongylonema pulchrum TaxID=637853 RepID=A0A183DEV1_9BILA